MSKTQQIREMAEADLYTFAVLVNPNRLYGEVHKESMRFLGAEDGSDDQLLLLPRGHQKSHEMATWCAWHITKHPDTTMVYVSATEDLAVAQLYAIKNILSSDIYRRYWPEMVHPEEAKREEWNVRNMKVDHPIRKSMGVRDSTVAARSIDANTTGLHGDVLVLDDIVVPENAYTMTGRQKVKAGYSQLSSVLNTGGITKVAGTRYHNADIYGMFLEMEREEFDDAGNIVGAAKVFEVFERPVEEDGEFTWPRSQHPKTKKWNGFDSKELAKIRAKYLAAGERAQYYAQYYNNPNAGITDDDSVSFQYYDRKYLTEQDGQWYFQGKVLSITMGGDLAYTTANTSDYTAFAVIGVTPDNMTLVLDLDQIRTDKYHRMYELLNRLYDKWHPKKCRIESNTGANLAVEYIKDQARKDGVLMVIEGKPAKGEKSERFQMIVQPRYATQNMWHYKGGLISVYEEQVTLPRPSHDDIRDAVSIAVEISSAPSKRKGARELNSRGSIIQFNDRFGGRVR